MEELFFRLLTSWPVRTHRQKFFLFINDVFFLRNSVFKQDQGACCVLMGTYFLFLSLLVNAKSFENFTLSP